MTRRIWQILAALLAATALVLPARAQQADPHVAYVYPAGAQQGTTVTITCGGQFLQNATKVLISGPGVETKVLEYVRPLTPGQFALLRDQLAELRKKEAEARGLKPSSTTQPSTQPTTRPTWTAVDQRNVDEILKKLAHPPRRNQSPALAEEVRVQVTLAPDAAPGQREVRVVTARGVSNPRYFWVGQLPEVARPLAQNERPLPALDVTLPVTINGQIMPGGVQSYRFHARKGESLVLAAKARALIPYLSDAVPGWFQATLTLTDERGREVAYDDDYRFNPDPLLHVVIPRDGTYTLAINDAIYRGREDFVYRIDVGALPYITDVFPLGGPRDAATAVTLRGWNLPTDHATVGPASGDETRGSVQVSADGFTSNAMPFAFGTLPECSEHDAGATPATAQQVSLPTIINGRIAAPGQVHVFAFQGTAGSAVVAEVTARRLGSPLDSVLTLSDAAGHQIAYNDDYDDPAAGLETDHADSYLSARLPADGTYYLRLADAQNKGGPAFAYRLRLSAPRPDFVLRALPSAINVRGGATVPLTVCAIRQDGFAGDITLQLAQPSRRLHLSGGVIPAGQDRVTCTLTADQGVQDDPEPIALEGRAMIRGRRVVHAAVPADDMQQAFSYHFLVPAEAQWLQRIGRWRVLLGFGMRGPAPLRLPRGGSATLSTAVPATLNAGHVVLDLPDAPDGITIRRAETAAAGLAVVLECDAKVQTGLRGNLVLHAFVERPTGKGDATRRVELGVLPAVPFEITGP